jgi:hypothetical protein
VNLHQLPDRAHGPFLSVSLPFYTTFNCGL